MLLRVFDARPGRESELLSRLEGIATGMIQEQRLDAVQICRFADSPHQILWIEDRGTDSRSRAVLEAKVATICAETLVEGPISQPFDLVDGFYRYPLPHCQVWSLELSAAPDDVHDALTHFLGRSRAAAAEPSVAGMSIYRALGAPRLLVFVALSEGVIPSDGSFGSPRLATVGKWRHLLVVWTMGRVTSGPDPRGKAASGLYPRPTFWARTMPVLAVAPMPEGS